MRPTEVLRRAAEYLAGHGVESPRETAEVLLMHVLGTDRAGLYARREALSTAQARAFGRALCQRCAGTPLQHLTGEQRFRGLPLEVAPGVFIPRPETEVVAEVALEAVAALPSPVVVDVGTGTGAIALSVKAERPDARVLATDVAGEAVALARRNAGRLGLDIEVLEGDLLAPLPDEVRGRVDLVVSNPPYVTAEEYEALPVEVRAEPPGALLGGVEFHRRLARESRTWLRPGGWLVMEVGAAQGGEVRGLLEGGYEVVEVLPDLAGRDRVVRGRVRA